MTFSKGQVRILCVGRDMRGGGAERVQATLLRFLNRDRFLLTAAYMSREGVLSAELPADVRAIYGNFGRASRMAAAHQFFKRLVALARQHDVIFGMQEGSPIYFAVLAALVTRRPAIGWIHNLWSRLALSAGIWNRPASKCLYPLAKSIICVSHKVQADLTAMKPELRPKLHVLANPLDTATISNQAHQAAPEWVHSWWTGKKILACGRLTRQKGFDLLLEGIAALRQKGLNCRLVILGEGEERSALLERTHALGLSDRVLLPGFYPNPYPIFKVADVFVLSSRFEGLGMVMLEAMVLGVPVVAFNCEGGGPEEILGDGSSGLLVEPLHTQQLADGVERLLFDHSFRSRCVVAASQKVRQYDAPLVARRFEDLFVHTVCDARSNLS